MKKFLRSVKVYIIYLLHSIPMLFYKKDTYKIYSDEETIDKIINDKLSICRYGDGEFRWMLKVKSSKDSFQKDNNEMSEKLLHILDDRHSKVLVGIPSMLNNCEDLTLDAKEFWIPFLFKYHKRIEKYVKKDVQYCNTNLTRPYMDYKCKDDEVVAKRFVNLKRIWGGRNIIIVEGVYSRLGVDNDLFDNALSIRRIICPAKNAYESYFKIFNSIINNHKENDLILLSLGPTATILAYEIGNIGIQCIDIGHVDIEYEWFLKKAKIKIPVQGKFVNEARTNKPIADIIDENYKKQIIDTILEN